MRTLLQASGSPRRIDLLGERLARLREEWHLTSGETQTLLGVGEASLLELARHGGGPLAGRILGRVEALDEVALLAKALLTSPEAAEWLRRPSPALRGRTPLEFMSREPGGAETVRHGLRAEYRELRG